jgi:hypothetical protein
MEQAMTLNELKQNPNMVERVAQMFHDIAWLHDEDAERYAKRVLAAVHHAELVEALRKIADMTDIEADFDGFEARQIATDALAKIGGEAW